MPMTIVWRNAVPQERPAVFWGTEFRNLRLAQHLSQRRLARLAGVDRASLARFELGRSRGNLQLVEKLAAVLGYEIDMVWQSLDQPREYAALEGPARPREAPSALPALIWSSDRS